MFKMYTHTPSLYSVNKHTQQYTKQDKSHMYSQKLVCTPNVCRVAEGSYLKMTYDGIYINVLWRKRVGVCIGLFPLCRFTHRVVTKSAHNVWFLSGVASRMCAVCRPICRSISFTWVYLVRRNLVGNLGFSWVSIHSCAWSVMCVYYLELLYGLFAQVM